MDYGDPVMQGPMANLRTICRSVFLLAAEQESEESACGGQFFLKEHSRKPRPKKTVHHVGRKSARDAEIDLRG